MATETFLDLAYERTKSTKRPLRPKLLKLTDVATPHRSRKKTKVKVSFKHNLKEDFKAFYKITTL